MIVNKKFDRLRQWGRERMGGEVRTDTNDEFKSLELEMQLRGEGMDRLNRSAKDYVKHISRRDAGDARDKMLPVTYFGNAMVSHGEDFEPDSEFGQCLSTLGRANERIGRMQETYSANATGSWLESIERSLVQMKEYNEARKKLDNRRLAYDTATAKMQKSKREDFRMEEELRSQKAKYEESSEDVYRRMMDIKEAEADSVTDLSSFLEAELTYYDRCREVLMQVKRDWPASNTAGNRSGSDSPSNNYNNNSRRNGGPRSRASSLAQRFGATDLTDTEPLEPPIRPGGGIRSRAPSAASSPRRELPGLDIPNSRPPITTARTYSGFEGPTSLSRADSPATTYAHNNGMPRLTRVPTEPTALLSACSGGGGGGKSSLRITKSREVPSANDVFSDTQSNYSSDSPLLAEPPSRTLSASWSASSSMMGGGGGGGVQDAGGGSGKKVPPPPPPSRAKKPPPPVPPPMKRSALSSGQVPRY